MASYTGNDVARLCREIVLQTKRDKALSSLTPRIVRQKVESLLNLEEGALDTKEMKDIVKHAITSAITESSDRPHKTQEASKKRRHISDDSNSDSETAKKSKRGSGATKKSSRTVYKSAEMIEDSDAEPSETPQRLEDVSVATSKVVKNAARENKKKKRAIPPDEESDSGMSVLIDDPPEPAKKRAARDKTKAKPKSKAAKDQGLTKDEATIKRLKSFVNACGVRKVWAKEFANLDRPSEQIKYLKKMLEDLGMSGRLSMEQAKAIKEKRELAQELEDVTKFNEAISKRTSKKTERSEKKTVVDAEDSEDDSNVVPTKKSNARNSIMAFLADQSDED